MLNLISSSPYIVNTGAQNQPTKNTAQLLRNPLPTTFFYHILPVKQGIRNVTSFRTKLPNPRAKAAIEKKMVFTFSTMSAKTVLSITFVSPSQKVNTCCESITNSQPKQEGLFQNSFIEPNKGPSIH